MPRFQDIVTDNEGNGLPGAIVTVRDYPSGNLSTLTADSGGSLTNPIVADSNGAYYFNAANAIYSLEFRLLAYEPAREVRLVNLGNLVDSVTLAASTGAALIGATDGLSGSLFTTVAGFIAKLLSSSGSSVIGFILSQTGGVVRTLLSKLSDHVHARDFGLVGDGSDETAKLTAFFNSAIANPGTPHRLAQLTYGYSAALPQINVSNVWIEANGYGIHDTGSVASGCVLSWLGAASPGVSGVTIAPVSGGSNQRLSGVKFRGIALSGSNGNLGTLLTLRSIVDCDIDVGTIEASVTGVYMGVVASLGESRDPQNNKIRIRGRQLVATGGYILTLDGDTTANTSANEFWIKGQISNTPGVKCINSDNNRWYSVEIFKSGTATYGMDLLGGASGAVASRAEIIYFYSSSVPIVARGTGTYTVASTGHRVFRLDLENGTPSPVLETGAWLDCEMPQSYTPAVTGTGGTGLTTSTIAGSYIRQGNFADVDVSAQMTAGTGYTALTITAPFAAAGSIGQTANVVEAASSEKDYSAYIAPGTSNIVLRHVDGSTAFPATGTYGFSIRYRVR